MPNHRISPNIAISEKFNRLLSVKAQLLYLLLFSQADDFGVLLAEPTDLKALLFPKNPHFSVNTIIKAEGELLDAGLCYFYTHHGKLYLQIKNFAKFQTFGKGYNRLSKYPPWEERDHSRVRFYHNEADLQDSAYQIVPDSASLLEIWQNASKGFKGLQCTTISISISNSISNNNNTTKNRVTIEDIEKLDLSVEEKEILRCFLILKYIIFTDEIEKWRQWLAELRKDYPTKNLVSNAKKWRDYFETKPPKNHKSSFRNWIAKPYADTCELSAQSVQDELFRIILDWGHNNNDTKIDRILPIWWQKYGKSVIQKIFNLHKNEDGGYHQFMVDMAALKGNSERSGGGLRPAFK